MFALLRKSPLLKRTLGSCVVLAATEAKEVCDAIAEEPLLNTIRNALSLRKNLLIL